MKWRFFCCILLLVSCNNGLQKTDASIFIHDNSSKVWVIQKKMADGKNYAPMRFEYREMIVFHENKNAYLHRIIDLGKVPGKKMSYFMDREKNEFVFFDGKKEIKFRLDYVSRKRLVLSPLTKNEKYTLILVPFPEY